MVLMTVFGSAIDAMEPTIRNSNLFPVKAKGEVRFLSVASFIKEGTVETPTSSLPPILLDVASPFSHNWFKTSSSCSPRNMEIIAGGASSAPRRWSFPGFAADSRSSGAYSSTAFIIAERISRNCLFWCGVVPGSRRLMPVSVDMDQLLCLPEPLMPAKGFSWSRQTRL